MLVKKDKAKKSQKSRALQKDNQGLGQKLPTKENVTALLTDFEWDAKTTTNREEAFRILTYQGALGEIKPNFSRPPYWTLGEAQRAADERNR